MNSQEEKTYNRLLDKAQESFILAIELFNRPTINYRVEGCSFFLCNAWELMLKAHIIKTQGYNAIYYPNNDRTLSLEACVKKVMTNKNDPIRMNIESICELRNTSTHFIVPEYEITYGPLFQANIKNFDDKLRDYHSIEISDRIPDNYLTLSIRKTDTDAETIRTRYNTDVAERLLRTQQNIDAIAQEQENTKYAALYKTEFVVSKKTGIPIRIDNESDTAVKIVKEIQVTDRYHLRNKDVIDIVNTRLQKNGITLLDQNGDARPFNTYHFNLINTVYSVKSNTKYAWDRSVTKEKNKSYLYSDEIVDFIYEILSKSPDTIVQTLRKKTKK